MSNPYSQPTLTGLRVEHVTVPLLCFDTPEHLEGNKTFVRWRQNIWPDEETGCWLWMGHTDKDGYGKMSFRVGGQALYARAHRWGYEALRGSVPQELVLDHLCRVRSCVNPWHLEPVTNAVNIRRGETGSSNQARANKITHCPFGHAYEGWNLIRYQGRRSCRKCMYRRNRDYKQRQREARA